MKKKFFQSAAACGLCLSLLASGLSAGAAWDGGNGVPPGGPGQSISQDGGAIPGLARQDGRMVIGEAGVYILRGVMRGTVYVDPGEGDVRLILDGVRLDGAADAAIAAVSGERLTIELADGTRSSVLGGADGAFDAAIYSTVPLSFEGGGELDLHSEAQDAIHVVDGALSFNGGSFRIRADENGLNAASIAFNGGEVAIDAAGESVASEAEVSMNGGTLSEESLPAVPASQPAQRSDSSSGGSSSGGSGGGSTGGAAAFAGAPAAAADNAQLPALPDDARTGMQQPPAMGDFQSGSQNGGMQQPPTMGDFQSGSQNGGMQQPPMMGDSQSGTQTGMQQPPTMNGSQNSGVQSTADSASAYVSGSTENSAMSLEADYDNATTITVTDEDGTVKIKESGTYIVTGSSDDGSITVTKGTTGVVLVLEDLDLTSTSGATLSVNKNAEVKVIVSGTVNLTDNENPDDENSADADVADAFDGAAIKVKADAVVFITGDGTLNLNGNARNGIKAGDNTRFIMGGEDLTVNITAANDGINGNYDVTLLSGNFNISAGDDGIHADHILTVGDETDHTGPNLTVSKSNEALEGTVVNIAGGRLNLTASDDAVNAANADALYEGELDYAVNMTGGSLTIQAGTDGIDSNGYVNLIGGSASIRSANNGGDAGIDYDAEFYLSDSFTLNNQSGVAGPDNMMGMPGQMGGGPQNGGSFGPQGGDSQSGGSFGPQSGGSQGGGFAGGPMGR